MRFTLWLLNQNGKRSPIGSHTITVKPHDDSRFAYSCMHVCMYVCLCMYVYMLTPMYVYVCMKISLLPHNHCEAP
jgi:hypothetical protein